MKFKVDRSKVEKQSTRKHKLNHSRSLPVKARAEGTAADTSLELYREDEWPETVEGDDTCNSSLV